MRPTDEQLPPGWSDSFRPVRPRRRYRVLRSPRAVMWMLGVIAIGMAIGSVVAWFKVVQARAVQSGPEAVATVLGHSTSSTSGRGGTTYTTHYRVVFQPAPGAGRVTTTVSASGLDPCGCGRTLVRYSPGHPSRAALAGDGATSLAAPAILTLMAIFLAVCTMLLWRALHRYANPATAPPGGAPLGPPAPAAPAMPARRRRAFATLAGASTLVVGVVVASAVFHSAGPSLSLARSTVAAAAGGGGTGTCMALPAVPTDPVALPGSWASRAIMAGLIPLPSGAGYPSYFPGSKTFDAVLQPVYNRLGGDVPPPGAPANSFEAYTGQLHQDGYRQVEIWSLADPLSAARFATAYVAAECYRFSRDTPVPASPLRTVGAPAGTVYSSVYGGAPGLVNVIAVQALGRYVVCAWAMGPASRTSQLQSDDAAALTRMDSTAGQ